MAWTPSDSIIVAVITAVTAVITTLLGKRKSENVPKENRLPPSEKSPQEVATNINLLARPKLTQITIAEIVENIEGVPPFQRDDTHKHYVGMRVRWSAILRSVARLSNSVQVTVKFIECDTLGFCYVTSDNAKVLVHAHEGTFIEVEGSIDEISKYEVSLIDCEIEPSPLMKGPYGPLLRQSPRDAIFAAWADVERVALRLFNSKVTNPSSETPVPFGAVVKVLQMHEVISSGQAHTMLQMEVIQAAVKAAPDPTRELRSAGPYCALAVDVVDQLRAK